MLRSCVKPVRRTSGAVRRARRAGSRDMVRMKEKKMKNQTSHVQVGTHVKPVRRTSRAVRRARRTGSIDMVRIKKQKKKNRKGKKRKRKKKEEK